MKAGIVVVAGSAAAIMMVLVVADHVLSADRNDLLEDLARDRLQELRQTAIEVEADLEQVEDDVELSRTLLRSATTASDRERELLAIMRNSREHRLARVYDEQGALSFEIARDRNPIPPLAIGRVRIEMDRLVATMLPGSEEAGAISSDPIVIDDQDRLRVIAVGWRRSGGGPAGEIALAVDTGSILRRLRSVAADRSTRLYLLGPEGSLEPFGDGIGIPPAALDSIRAVVEGRKSGVVRVPSAAAEQLGLGDDEGVAAFVRFGNKSARYLAATVTSSSIMREQQQVIVRRVSTAAGALLLLFTGLGGWAFVGARRSIALREMLRHAERIAHEHEKAEKILESVPTLVVTLSADGRVTAVNSAFEQRAGSCALGGPIETVFPKAKRASVERVRSLLAEAKRTQRPRAEYGPNLTLFGEEGQYSLHAAPLEHPLTESETLLVIEDLTRLGALEAQLLRAEKLATVGVLSAGVAHEIGTPLGIARGRAEFVISKLAPDDKRRGHLTLVLEQIDRVTRTMRQLLDFTRARAIQTKRVELPAAVANVSELLRFELERKKLVLELELDEGLWPLRAQPDELEQVLLNVLLNACHASREGGRIVIRASQDPSDDELQLVCVEDFGAGIPAHLRSRVFDPFFTTKKRGQGTGLGLTIVQQIVTNHGGRLDLESEEGTGTRVMIWWPTTR